MIEIMVVDDQRLVRRCISAKLNAVEDFTVTAEAASGEEARDAVRACHFDVILMDLNMPGIGGLEATRRVLAARPESRILGLSMYVSGPYPKQFLRTGGAGYVSKNTDTEELVQAIRTVNEGECYISADVAQHIAPLGPFGSHLEQRFYASLVACPARLDTLTQPHFFLGELLVELVLLHHVVRQPFLFLL